MHRIEVNCETGEIIEIPLAEEEVAELEAEHAKEQAAAAERASTPPLTARERLEAAGFSIPELRELLLGADDGDES